MKTSEKKYAYDIKYAKVKLQQVKFSLHRDRDADLLEWLDQQPNKSGYFKQLIREDMERKKQI